VVCQAAVFFCQDPDPALLGDSVIVGFFVVTELGLNKFSFAIAGFYVPCAVFQAARFLVFCQDMYALAAYVRVWFLTTFERGLDKSPSRRQDSMSPVRSFRLPSFSYEDMYLLALHGDRVGILFALRCFHCSFPYMMGVVGWQGKE
jgi:hypothetical protein